MVCNNCNREMAEEAVYCRRCGTKYKPSNLDLLDNSLYKTDWQFYVKKGEEFAAARKPFEALEFFEKAMEINSNEPTIYNARGQCYITMLSFQESRYKNKEALEDFSTALRLNPNNLQTLANIGNAQIRLFKYNEAIDSFTKILLADPFNINAINSRAIAKLNIGDFKGARKDALVVLKTAPNHQYSLHIYGTSLLSLCHFKKGTAILKKVANEGYDLAKMALNNMKSTQYLIIAEIKNKGFVMRAMADEVEAKTYSDKLLKLSSGYQFDGMFDVLKKINFITTYTIKGNQVYTGKTHLSVSDESYTVSVLKIDVNTFCLKTFIKERENHSIVFDHKELTGEFLDNFPNHSMIAN